MITIPALIVLNKDKLRDKEMKEIREHCKDNKGVSMHENEYNMCVHLLDKCEIPFHTYIYKLLIKTAKRWQRETD